MSNQVVPTKGNLLATKKSLELARTGFELLDRKRNILIREMMALIDRANAIQDKIDKTYEEAYAALQMANITLGICDELSKTVPVDNGLNVAYRSWPKWRTASTALRIRLRKRRSAQTP